MFPEHPGSMVLSMSLILEKSQPLLFKLFFLFFFVFFLLLLAFWMCVCYTFFPAQLYILFFIFLLFFIFFLFMFQIAKFLDLFLGSLILSLAVILPFLQWYSCLATSSTPLRCNLPNPFPRNHDPSWVWIFCFVFIWDRQVRGAGMGEM